jgi:hypoxanthine-DNA glycosylase
MYIENRLKFVYSNAEVIFMTNNKPNCIGFSPSTDKNCTILILGSMPGITSLEKQQYYAHPQNRFWPLMAYLLEHKKQPPEKYEERLAMLLHHHIALWDSINTCERTGSLDTSIHHEAANDFAKFFTAYPHIHTVCFNGAKSYQTFKKYNKPLLKNESIRFLPMPSTSPANARWHMDMLIEAWQIIFIHNKSPKS